VLAKGLATPGVPGSSASPMQRVRGLGRRKAKGLELKTLGFRMGEKLTSSQAGGRPGCPLRPGGMRLFVSGGPRSRPRGSTGSSRMLGFTVLEGTASPRPPRDLREPDGKKNRSAPFGAPVPGTQVKIAEDGEILIKGGGVMKEYYRRPRPPRRSSRTAGSTRGTSASWTPTATSDHDRKKDSSRLGRQVHRPAEPRERAQGDPLVSQVVVHGDHAKYVTALSSAQHRRTPGLGRRAGPGRDEPLHANPR